MLRFKVRLVPAIITFQIAFQLSSAFSFLFPLLFSHVHFVGLILWICNKGNGNENVRQMLSIFGQNASTDAQDAQSGVSALHGGSYEPILLYVWPKAL